MRNENPERYHGTGSRNKKAKGAVEVFAWLAPADTDTDADVVAGAS